MAERKPLFMSDLGWPEEMALTDTLTAAQLTLGAGPVLSATGFDMNSQKITDMGAGTADGDALAFGQASAELADLTLDTGNLDMNSTGKIVNLVDPTADQDGATKAYVDSVAQGLDIHESVRATTTVAGTLATSFEDGDQIDGVTLATGDRILIKNQASGVENGIYTVNASGAPTRAVDWDTGYEAAGAFVFVEEGTVNADSGWVCTNNSGSDETGTDALAFSQFSGAGQITAGNGLTKSGNTLDVGPGNGISVAADSVAVNPDSTGGANLARAIDVNSNGVAVKIDNDTIVEGASNRLEVGTIAGTNLDSDIDITTTGDVTINNPGELSVYGNITSTDGIFTGDGSGLTNIGAGSADAVTVTAKKSTAGTINAGQVVHLVSYSSPDYTVELADADTSGLLPAIGIVTTTITDSTAGTVVISGKATGLDTSAWAAGDGLWVSTTAGALTNTRPTGAGNGVQRLGEVAFSNASTGVIQITGAGRTNDLPNIAEDNLWIGDSSGVAASVPIGDGLTSVSGTTLKTNITSDIGLVFNGGTGALEIELDNTPDTLDADADGLKVVGLPSLFKVNDVAVSANVTATNLNALTGGGQTALHTHPAVPATEAPKVENTLTTVTDATANGDPVCIVGNGLVRKAVANGDDARARVIGIIRTGAGAAGATPEVVSQGLCDGVLTGATAGTAYYLDSAGGITPTFGDIGAGERVVRVGYAYNATDLWVHIDDFGKKAA